MRLVTDAILPATFPWCRYCLKPAFFVIVNSVDYIDLFFLHSVNGDNSYFFLLFSSAALVLQLETKRKAKV
jgi:hypothetical protein